MATPTRRPYIGACHCGFTKFIAFLTLPHSPVPAENILDAVQRFYRCNCTVCHKSGIFHARVADAAEDFLLLSPLDPATELGDYRSSGMMIQFFFCRRCGGRCISFFGEGEVVEVDLREKGLTDDLLARLGVGAATGGKVKAWRPKKDVFTEVVKSPAHAVTGGDGYLSINACAFEPGQEGLDLSELTETKMVCYLDLLGKGGKNSYERPANGGAY